MDRDGSAGEATVMATPRPLAQALCLGARRRCPRCGIGPLFRRGTEMHDACSGCGLRYLRNPGDPWAFLLFLDRGFFILPPIAVLYFRLLPGSLALMLTGFAAWIALIVYTTPHRYGLAVALDYVTRRGPDGWKPGAES